jgi:hypothetical protein
MMPVDEVLIPDGFFPRHTADGMTAPESTALVVKPPSVSVETVKQQLLDLTTQLLTVTDVQQAKLLNIDIQRRRVVLILLQEQSGLDTSGDYMKEMTLLNRMLQGEEAPEGSAESDAERAAAAAKAEQVLADRGIDPLAAARIIHVLDALVSRVTYGSGSPPHR